jgi:hypothetical protein
MSGFFKLTGYALRAAGSANAEQDIDDCRGGRETKVLSNRLLCVAHVEKEELNSKTRELLNLLIATSLVLEFSSSFSTFCASRKKKRLFLLSVSWCLCLLCVFRYFLSGDRKKILPRSEASDPAARSAYLVNFQLDLKYSRQTAFCRHGC